MIRVCYGCRQIMGEKEPFEDRSETHGLCDPCLAIEIANIKRTRDVRRETGDVRHEMKDMGRETGDVKGGTMNANTDQPLTELEGAILAVLNEHKGHDNAIHRADLVRQVANSCPDSPDKDRMIRKALEHLTERHYEWIGSGPFGYFMIDTEDDRKRVSDYYKSYGLSLLHRAARVERSSMLTLLGQLTLRLEGRSRLPITERRKA
jgi:hypothetical protein